MNIEKIKFGNTEFYLVPNGISLGKEGGEITFQKGDLSFEEIESILIKNDTISQIGLSGELDWSRSDMIYSEVLTKQANYIVETIKIDTDKKDDNGNVITETNDIKTDVMIAEFRLPDIREELDALKKENETIKQSLGTILISNLERGV